MTSYEVTYEMQNGEYDTINVTSANLIKAAQFAENFLSIRVKGYSGLVEVKEHIYNYAETPARASTGNSRPVLMMAG